MAVNPVQNYLDGVVRYYQLDQAAQQQQQYNQPIMGGVQGGGIHLVPAFGFGGGGYNRGPNVNVVGGPDVLDRMREHQREDRADDRASSAACLGAILTIIGAAGLACVMSSWNEIGERLDAAREFKEDQLPLIQNHQEKAELTQIVNKDIRILEKKASRARNIVILTAVALTSAAAAFAGGMFAVQWLITAAIVVGVATVAVGVFAAVYYALQKSEKPEEVMNYLRAHPMNELRV